MGIITERDLMTRVLAKEKIASKTLIGDVMTPSPLTVSPDISVEDSMRLMTEKCIRHLPVMRDNELLGIVSIGDLTRWAIRNQSTQINDLMRYITGAAG